MTSTETDHTPTEVPLAGPAQARRLFRYLGGDEWAEYRAIMDVFANTFFSEFTPDDVIARLGEAGADVDPDVVPDRLESLRRWGNLTVSTSVGNPASLADYYRRRNLYLITREGQEVHGLVEGVLTRVHEVADVESGRLRDLQHALLELQALVDGGLDGVSPEVLADRVRAVFDPHESFTDEVSQFFASLNQWQSRYDLKPEDLQFFAEVLVGYVSEQLSVIERHSRPIARSLDQLERSLDRIVDRLETGLAARVDAAGLGDQVAIRRTAGSRRADWELLARWYKPQLSGRSRIDELTGQAVLAVRTLTANLTRLSGVGLGTVSRRADFINLARFFAEVGQGEDAHRLAAASFGLSPARHVGVEGEDVGDPVPSNTPWAAGPKAPVPLAVRERGDTSMRGRTSPMRDRSAEKELLRRRRQGLAALEARTAVELLEAADGDGALNGATLSTPAFGRLRDLIGQSTHGARADEARRTASDDRLICEITRTAGVETVVACPEGRLTLIDLDLKIMAAEKRS